MIFSTYSGFSRTYPTANQGRSEQESTSALRGQPWWGQLASLSYDFASDPVYSPHRHCKHCSKGKSETSSLKTSNHKQENILTGFYKLPLNLMSVDLTWFQLWETWAGPHAMLHATDHSTSLGMEYPPHCMPKSFIPQNLFPAISQ